MYSLGQAGLTMFVSFYVFGVFGHRLLEHLPTNGRSKKTLALRHKLARFRASVLPTGFSGSMSFVLFAFVPILKAHVAYMLPLNYLPAQALSIWGIMLIVTKPSRAPNQTRAGGKTVLVSPRHQRKRSVPSKISGEGTRAETDTV